MEWSADTKTRGVVLSWKISPGATHCVEASFDQAREGDDMCALGFQSTVSLLPHSERHYECVVDICDPCPYMFPSDTPGSLPPPSHTQPFVRSIKMPNPTRKTAPTTGVCVGVSAAELLHFPCMDYSQRTRTKTSFGLIINTLNFQSSALTLHKTAAG